MTNHWCFNLGHNTSSSATAPQNAGDLSSCVVFLNLLHGAWLQNPEWPMHVWLFFLFLASRSNCHNARNSWRICASSTNKAKLSTKLTRTTSGAKCQCLKYPKIVMVAQIYIVKRLMAQPSRTPAFETCAGISSSDAWNLVQAWMICLDSFSPNETSASHQRFACTSMHQYLQLACPSSKLVGSIQRYTENLGPSLRICWDSSWKLWIELVIQRWQKSSEHALLARILICTTIMPGRTI